MVTLAPGAPVAGCGVCRLAARTRAAAIEAGRIGRRLDRSGHCPAQRAPIVLAPSNGRQSHHRGQQPGGRPDRGLMLIGDEAETGSTHATTIPVTTRCARPQTAGCACALAREPASTMPASGSSACRQRSRNVRGIHVPPGIACRAVQHDHRALGVGSEDRASARRRRRAAMAAS